MCVFFTFSYYVYFLNFYYGFHYIKVINAHCKFSQNTEFKSKSTAFTLPQFHMPKVNC